MGLLPFDILAQIQGNAMAKPSEDKARQLAMDHYNRMMGIQTPDLQKVDPSMQGGTEFDNANVNPAYRGAQMQALNSMIQRGNEGYTSTDKAANQQMLDESAQQERGQRGALMQGMQARGMGGGNAELAQQLAGQQGAASRANMAGTQLAANGRMMALNGMIGAGQLGGQMQSQAYGEAANRAAAQDAVNARNTASRNNGMYYNAQLPQQNFDNSMTLEHGRGGAGRELEGGYYRDADRARGQTKEIADSAGDTLKTVGRTILGGGGGGGAPTPTKRPWQGSGEEI